MQRGEIPCIFGRRRFPHDAHAQPGNVEHRDPADSRSLGAGFVRLFGRAALVVLAAALLWACERDGTGDDGRRVPSGTYIYRLRTGTESLTGRMTMVK